MSAPPRPHSPIVKPGESIPLAWALVPVISLVGFLYLVILRLPEIYPKFEGSGHIPLLLAAVVAGLVAHLHGWGWDELKKGLIDGIRMALGAILILVVIGMLMGTWILGGVVPALIDWGLMLLSPSYFLPTACAVCSIVSLVSGSSWSTAGTVGLALIGIGGAMGVDPAMTAGAVVSGAYFGDKLSPMSDTTNLAPAMAGTDLFTHIRHMVYTTLPSWLIAMTIYVVMSLSMTPASDAASVDAIRSVIQANFHPGFVHLIPPVVVVGMVMRGMPALPTLLLGAALGGVLGILAEGATLAQVIDVSMTGFVADTGDKGVDELLSRGGMMSMANTVLLVFCAMSFGGLMERTGMLRTLASQLLRLARSTGSLVATTVLTAAGINIVAADQYISIVVPGRMFAPAYEERGLHPKNLSRAIEDGGTITSPLVPWNTCGAFMAATLMVPTGAYLPYAFLNFINPIISIIYGFTGFSIAKLDDKPKT